MQTIEARVADVIATQLRKAPELVSADASLADDLGADSLDVVEIVMALETEFDLNLIAKEAKVTTVREVVDYIRAAIEKRDEAPAASAAPSTQAEPAQ